MTGEAIAIMCWTRPSTVSVASSVQKSLNTRLGWWILGYNCRCLRALGKRVPPDTMPPKAHIIVFFVLFYYLSHSWITLVYIWSCFLLMYNIDVLALRCTWSVHGLPRLVHSCSRLWGQGQNWLRLWALCDWGGRADCGWFLRGSTVCKWWPDRIWPPRRKVNGGYISWGTYVLFFLLIEKGFIICHFVAFSGTRGTWAGDLVNEAPSLFEPSSQGHGELNSVTL